MLLEEIHSPSDIKKLSIRELAALAEEMRAETFVVQGDATDADVQAFLHRLEARHISATVRREMGADIEGACGQLRRRVLEDRQER